MTGWTHNDLERMGAAEELQLATFKKDGTLKKPITIWVIRVGDDVYMRSWRGREGAWFRVAEKYGWTRFVSMQDHLNLLYREEEREMLPLCREEKVGVIPYSPLASGRLTRNWSSTSTLRSETDQIAKSKYDATAQTDQQVVKRVAEIAQQHGVPRVHIALAWLLQKKSVNAPIIGATKITHLEDAVGALSVQLTQERLHTWKSRMYRIPSLAMSK